MSINFGDGSSTQQYGGAGSSGQNWTTVSRSNNTWYQNTTGRPIMLAVGMYTSKTLRVGSATNNYADIVSTGGDPSEAMNGQLFLLIIITGPMVIELGRRCDK